MPSNIGSDTWRLHRQPGTRKTIRHVGYFPSKKPETVIPETHGSNTTDPLSGRGGPAALNPAVSLERSPIRANSEAKVECWEVDSAGDFARKKPKPPYVFRHPSQRNRRGDLARLRKFGETTPRSKVREPKQRVRSLSRSGGVSQPKSFRRFGSLPLV